MDDVMRKLCREYGEAKSIIYGLSISDFLLLHEQALKEGSCSITLPSSETVTADRLARSTDTGLARCSVPSPVEEHTPVRPERVRKQQSPSKPMSDLEILKSLGE